MRILVADSEISVRLSIAELLTRDYEVALASDGEEVLTRCRAASPDLLILAQNLNGMEWGDVCRQLREDEQLKAVRILVLTLRNNRDRGRGVVCGETRADEFLAKPFRPSALMSRVRTLLRRQSVLDPAGVRRVNDLLLNRDARTVERSGTAVDVTPIEFDLLWVLVSHPARSFTRHELFDSVSSRSVSVESFARSLRSLKAKFSDGAGRIQHTGGGAYTYAMPVY